MLEITSIDKGIVIDHIKAGFGFKVYNYLNLDKAEYNVALITNAYSEKMGKKDIIKINNVIDIDYTFLGLIDPNITVNIIDNGKTVKKVKLEVPQNAHTAANIATILLSHILQNKYVHPFCILTFACLLYLYSFKISVK